METGGLQASVTGSMRGYLLPAAFCTHESGDRVLHVLFIITRLQCTATRQTLNECVELYASEQILFQSSV